MSQGLGRTPNPLGFGYKGCEECGVFYLLVLLTRVQTASGPFFDQQNPDIFAEQTPCLGSALAKTNIDGHHKRNNHKTTSQRIPVLSAVSRLVA